LLFVPRGALSAISHNYTIGCRDGQLTTRIQTIFVTGRSWVAPQMISSGLLSRIGLAHEQLHFDLAEVYARRARKRLAELLSPCSHSDTELNAMAEGVLNEAKEAHRRYDLETESGDIEARQREWAARIAADLTLLSRFADAGKPESASAFR
jgi:hypothetical protein